MYYNQQHVFEHLKDLDKFLNDINYNLNENGTLILEVLMLIFLKNGLLTVSLQHIHYFNEFSLRKILNINNFWPIKIINTRKFNNIL